MSERTIEVAGLILAFVSAVSAVGAWLVPFIRRRSRPFLIPRFDNPWSKGSDSNRNAIVVYNSGNADAQRVSIEPIVLDDGTVLTTSGAEALVRAQHEHTFVLKLQVGQHGVLQLIPQETDIPTAVWEHLFLLRAIQPGYVLQKRFLDVFVTFLDLKGNRHRGTWAFENDASVRRLRLVFVNQVKGAFTSDT